MTSPRTPIPRRTTLGGTLRTLRLTFSDHVPIGPPNSSVKEGRGIDVGRKTPKAQTEEECQGDRSRQTNTSPLALLGRRGGRTLRTRPGKSTSELGGDAGPNPFPLNDWDHSTADFPGRRKEKSTVGEKRKGSRTKEPIQGRSRTRNQKNVEGHVVHASPEGRRTRPVPPVRPVRRGPPPAPPAGAVPPPSHPSDGPPVPPPSGGIRAPARPSPDVVPVPGIGGVADRPRPPPRPPVPAVLGPPAPCAAPAAAPPGLRPRAHRPAVPGVRGGQGRSSAPPGGAGRGDPRGERHERHAPLARARGVPPRRRRVRWSPRVPSRVLRGRGRDAPPGRTREDVPAEDVHGG